MSTKEDLMLAEIADLRNRIYRAESPVFNGRLDSWQAACGKARGESESLRNEIRELKAENAGLRTGYEAYERVNAELKAEVEALRTALGPLLTHWDDVKPGESMNVDRARSAMRWGECP